jgi:hypothetical protein
VNQEVFSVNDQVLVITRRLYNEDLRRHFIGRVIAASEGLIRVEGNAWVAGTVGTFERRPEKRVRVFSIVSGTEILFVIPNEIDMDNLEYRTTAIGRLVLTDQIQFSLDLSEFGNNT